MQYHTNWYRVEMRAEPRLSESSFIYGEVRMFDSLPVQSPKQIFYSAQLDAIDHI